MDESNQVASGPDNQSVATSETTLMSKMTTVTHSVSSHIVDDFEPDPKCEITTLEKASYDCNDIMEKVIDDIVELGGCQQFPGIDQQEAGIDREETVEHIQREIIGDRNHTHYEQKNQPDHAGQAQLMEQQEQRTQHEVELQLRLESQTNQTTKTVDQHQNKQAKVEKVVPVQEIEEEISTSTRQQTDLNTTQQNTVPTTEEISADEQKHDDPPLENKSVEVLDKEASKETSNVDTQEIQNQSEVINGEDQDQVKSVVEEIVAAENIVEESIQEDGKVVETIAEASTEHISEDAEKVTEEQHGVLPSDTTPSESLETKPEAAPLVEKVDLVETSVETKWTPGRRGRRPKSKTVVVAEPRIERPKRTRGSIKSTFAEDQKVDDSLKVEKSEQQSEEPMDVEKGDQSRSIQVTHEHKEVVEEMSENSTMRTDDMPEAETKSKDDELVVQEPEPELEAEPEAEAQAEPEPEPEPEKPTRSVRVRTKRSFPEAMPQESEKKTLKKTKVEKTSLPLGRGLLNPKLKLPIRSRVTISTSRPATKPERHCNIDDFGIRKYRCDLCRFSTDRLNTIVTHQKNAVCEAAKRRYESHVQESLHKLQSPKGNKKRYSR